MVDSDIREAIYKRAVPQEIMRIAKQKGSMSLLESGIKKVEEGITSLEEILSVEGIDMVQFGPCDYSLSAGLVGNRGSSKVREAEEYVIKKAIKANPTTEASTRPPTRPSKPSVPSPGPRWTKHFAVRAATIFSPISKRRCWATRRWPNTPPGWRGWP
mgnify:CR=1 FL=1